MVDDVSDEFALQEFTRYFEFMRHWGDLHEKFVECAAPRFAELPPTRRRDFLAKVIAEDDLLISMSSDLGLFREVVKRLRSRPWFGKDLESLTSEVLTEMLFPDKQNNDDERGRLYEQYPEIFFKLDHVNFDGPRIFPIQLTDIESDMIQRGDLDSALTCVRWSAVSKDVCTEEEFTELMQELKDHGMRLRGVDPLDLESLLDFQDVLIRNVMEVTRIFGLPGDQASWILHAVQDRVMIPETLHFLLMQAMGLRMFREMDREARNELLSQEYKVHLGLAYASRSVLLLGDYHRDRIQAPEKVLKAIEAYVRDGKQQFALELCLDSIKNLPMGPSQTDQMEFTSGILFLANEKPRKAAEVFQLSLISARGRGDEVMESMVSAYLGSSYALLKRKEESHKAFEDSLQIVQRRNEGAADMLEELMVMAELAHESNEHRVEKTLLQRALQLSEGKAEEVKFKQHILLMIEEAEALSSCIQHP